MPIDQKHKDYQKFSEFWDLMLDVCSSQREVHALKEKYIPRLDGMTDEEFDAYVKRASFPLFTKHILTTFIGMIMRKDILTENISQSILDNFNGAGDSLYTYTSKLIPNFLRSGRCGTLIDYSQGLRQPRALLYNENSIINWRTELIDGKRRLVLVVLEETKTIQKDQFTVIEEPQYRVLSLENGKYRQVVYDKDGQAVKEFNIRMNRKPLKKIPFIFHGGIGVDYPPLLSIAEQNFSWYRLDAEFKHGLHYVGLPTPYATGVDPEDPHAPKKIGPTGLWFLPEGSIAGMIEFTGAGLRAFSDAKEEVYESIITLSSRILAPQINQNETATAANIRNAAETASLAQIVNTLSDDLVKIIKIMMEWVGRPSSNIVVEINTDFIPVILSGADVASYVASYIKGGISFKTLFEVLKNGEIVSGDRILKDELTDIDKEQQKRLAAEILLASEMAALKPPKLPKSGEQANNGQKFKEN